jgi:CRISPR-associated protein Csd2
MLQPTDPSKKHDFMLVFEVTLGNPNGDPDQDNSPRQNLETDQGLVSDGCIKRKIRNFIDDYFANHEGYEIFVKENSTLNKKIEDACTDLGLSFQSKEDKISKKFGKDKELAVREALCKRYYDLRMFGGVLTTGRDAGQVRGPIQINTGFSLKPITLQEFSITRKAITREEEAGKQGTFGKKWVVPHAVYVVYGHYSPNDGAIGPRATGVSQEDLERFYTALKNMFETDRSASRGLLTARGLYVFTHECAYGNHPAQLLFESIKINTKTEKPSSFADYDIVLPNQLPKGVSLDVMIG